MTSRATIGVTAITTRPMCTNQGFANFVCNHELLSSEYLAYYLPAIRPRLEQLAGQTTFKEITKSTLFSVTIPLPPLPEQQRIVTILRKADDLRRLRRQANARASELLPALFHELFGSFNGEGQQQFVVLDKVADVVSGIAKGRNLGGQNTVTVPYLRVANVQAGYLDLAEIKTIEALPAEVVQYRLRKNDILMTEGGDFDKLGRGALWNADIPDCIHQNHVFRVRLNQEQVLPRFFEQYLQMPFAKSYFLRASKRTTNIASINLTQLKALPVPVIDIESQERFIEVAARVRGVGETSQQATDRLDKLFKSLITEAYSGILTAALRAENRPEWITAAAERDRLLGIAQHVRRAEITAAQGTEDQAVPEAAGQRSADVYPARHALLRSLSATQDAVFRTLHGAARYMTVDTLAEQASISRKQVAHTIDLLVRAGVVQAVSIPTDPTGNQTVYVRAYRPVRDGDDMRDQDISELETPAA